MDDVEYNSKRRGIISGFCPFRSIFMKEILQDVIPSMQQIVDGLELYGLLKLIRENENIFYYAFCPNDELNWTFDKVEELLVPIYSNAGSSKKAQEINTFKALVECLESCYEEGITTSILCRTLRSIIPN